MNARIWDKNARIWDNETNGQIEVPCNDAQAVAKAQLELMDRIASALERINAHMPA